MVVSAKWRFFLCSRSGVRIAGLSRAATNKKVGIRRNRPDSITFDIPSDDPQLSQMMDDGFPMLEKQLSVVKGYRLEDENGYPATVLTGTWVLRVACIVWQIEDNGDENGVAMSSVSAFSPLILLDKMPTIGVAPGTRFPLVFDSIDAGEVFAALVNAANTDAGF
jgi:hypothetical protein